MAIALQTFNTGDTDYIAKLNSNSHTVEEAINAMLQANVAAGGAYTIGSFIDGLFNGETSLIGIGSYAPTVSVTVATDLLVAPGTMYKATTSQVLSTISMTLPFAGLAAGTYYVTADGSGNAMRSSDPLDALYSVAWNGSAFGAILRVAKCLYTVQEEDGARKSAAMGLEFGSLDARLEAGEQASATFVSKAIRRVCLTIDGGSIAIEPGMKGTIQVDFAGTIIGWSLTADFAGLMTIVISKKGSAEPPAAPSIPDPVADKITSTVPVVLDGAQSASGDDAAILSWAKSVAPWDVFQFEVTVSSIIKKATLVLRIQEELPGSSLFIPPSTRRRS